MIDINKEAEEYLLGFREGEVPKSFEEVKQIYVAGYNSKATQAKIIQAQIDILYEFRDYVENSSIFNDRIFKLQQQLKELEDANEI
jgi:hypothetical protein